MNKTIYLISYVITILCISYLVLSSGFDVIWQTYVGGNILYYHPDLPLTEDYSGEATIIPNILLFIYVLLSGIYFIIIGRRKLKIKCNQK